MINVTMMYVSDFMQESHEYSVIKSVRAPRRVLLPSELFRYVEEGV
jgi:hypothetical protein